MLQYEKESGISDSGVSVSCYISQQTEFADDLKEFTDRLRMASQSESSSIMFDSHDTVHDVAAGLLAKAEW